MPDVDPDLCDCPCHTATGTAHAAPCCEPCRICGQRIKMGRYRDHLRAHLETPALRAEVRDLAARGESILAYRIYQQGTGCAHAEAREGVARLLAAPPETEPAPESEESPAMAETETGMRAEHPQHAPLHRLPPEHGNPSGAHRCTAHEGMVAHTKGAVATRSYAGGGAGDDDAGGHMSGRSA